MNTTPLCTRIQETFDRSLILRFFTSHTVLAFFYGIFLFLYELRFVRELAADIHPFFIAWAGGVAVYDLFIRRIGKQIPFKWLLLVFMALAMVTAVVNVKLGLTSAVKAWVLTVLPLFAFYPVCLIKTDRVERDKALVRSFLGASFVIFIASAISLWMYMTRFNATIVFRGIEKVVGYVYYIKGDPTSGVVLFGIYQDTNHAAVYALVFALYSVILFWMCYKKQLFRHTWQNVIGCVYAVVNFLLQVSYFPLANSRGGWLCLIVAVVICAFLFFFFKKWPSRKMVERLVMSTVASALCVGMIGGGTLLVRNGLSELSYSLNNPGVSTPGQPNDPDLPDNPEDPEDPENPDDMAPPKDTFEKVDDGFGAGRLLIWREALVLFTDNPIFGVNPGNVQYYAQQRGGGDFLQFGKAIHNSYLDLLLDYGIFGFAVLMIFWGGCLVVVLRRMCRYKEKVSPLYYGATLAVLFVAGGSMFLSNVFINTTAMYFIMLIFGGYLVADKDQKEVSE